jgi:inactivated superfamily I helicase/RecB family exonuclease
MFDPTDRPRIFGSSPGVDFAQGLVEGLEERFADLAPHDWAKVEIYVNTTRMRRRIRSVFDNGPARLLPRIRLVTELADDPITLALRPAVPPLERRLQLSQFISKLLDQEPDLAPRAALYDLSDSLAALMDEMQGEGVAPDAIAALDVSDQSGHWERALRFLKIITPFFASGQEPPDKEARQRMVVEALAESWQTTPPAHPVIVAGSTGSRGATALFMQAVAKLPQGAIILPGYDFDLPGQVWQGMQQTTPEEIPPEDHPQYRFRHLMDLIDFAHDDVGKWSTRAPADAQRNKLISLSLRPAPVTDQWRSDGPELGDMLAPTAALTLVEASSPRAEAEAIALRLRQAVDENKTAALISPDRMLTRQVTAALDRWDITPDDSAGLPLPQSAPGRFLRHVADLYCKPLTGEALLILLKHPLCHSNRPDRGDHLRHTHELELHLRRHGPPFPTAGDLDRWASKDERRANWTAWLTPLVCGLQDSGEQDLGVYYAQHIALAEALSAGPDGAETGGLWDKAAGREARRVCETLRLAAGAGGLMTARDYAALFGGIIADGVVRDRDVGHPDILIWGTLEARVHGVDLTILGGMNDGVWPEAPAPDPWLNRMMRAQAGLLLPERKIGLSAHDYQLAIAGPEVWVTRAKRSADAETVPSRWVNRLTNLLKGLPEQHGPEALKAMQARGDHWLAMAHALSTPKERTAPAPRPSPCPPVAARPDRLSVTQIKTLIRDPFAIYARKTLRLDPLDPLVPSADAPLRGIIIHRILERFIKAKGGPDHRDLLIQVALEEFTKDCPWPTIRAQWMARMERSVDIFLAGEATRQAQAKPFEQEVEGEIVVAPSGVLLTCNADRIDLTEAGEALIYDYKTGIMPTGPQQEKFDKQLLLEAAMVEHGAFEKIGERHVTGASFIGVNAGMNIVPAPLAKQPPDQVWAELETLFGNWDDPTRGYTARLALFLKTDHGPYDHLSRYGEWDTSDEPAPEVLT